MLVPTDNIAKLRTLAARYCFQIVESETLGALRLVEPGLTDLNKRVLWLHWAGFQLSEATPNPHLWLWYGGAADGEAARGEPPR